MKSIKIKRINLNSTIINEKINQLKDYEQKFDIDNIIINNLKKNKDEFINKIDMLEKEVTNRINRNEMMCVNFTSSDQYINYSIPCTSSDIFAELEEKLYKEYPKYRETKKVFLHNGDSILRSKTIAENKIESGKPILLNIF